MQPVQRPPRRLRPAVEVSEYFRRELIAVDQEWGTTVVKQRTDGTLLVPPCIGELYQAWSNGSPLSRLKLATVARIALDVFQEEWSAWAAINGGA